MCPARLLCTAAEEQHTAAFLVRFISAWLISMAGLPVAAEQAQHTAVYIDTRHVILASPPGAAAQAQRAVALRR